MRRDFRKMLNDAGLNGKDWAPRELRHSSVSLLPDRNAPIKDISQVVGATGFEPVTPRL